MEYLDVDWSATRWSNGCYGSFAPPGVYADLGPWLRRPIGVIRWAGTETSPMWTGYVEGAIRSGERASAEGRELLDAARPVTSPARGWAEPPGAASGVRFNRTWRWAMME